MGKSRHFSQRHHTENFCVHVEAPEEAKGDFAQGPRRQPFLISSFPSPQSRDRSIQVFWDRQRIAPARLLSTRWSHLPWSDPANRPAGDSAWDGPGTA